MSSHDLWPLCNRVARVVLHPSTVKSTVGLFADNAVIYLAITDDQLYPFITRSFKPRDKELGISIFLISFLDPSSILISRGEAGGGDPHSRATRERKGTEWSLDLRRNSMATRAPLQKRKEFLFLGRRLQ